MAASPTPRPIAGAAHAAGADSKEGAARWAVAAAAGLSHSGRAAGRLIAAHEQKYLHSPGSLPQTSDRSSLLIAATTAEPLAESAGSPRPTCGQRISTMHRCSAGSPPQLTLRWLTGALSTALSTQLGWPTRVAVHSFATTPLEGGAERASWRAPEGRQHDPVKIIVRLCQTDRNTFRDTRDRARPIDFRNHFQSISVDSLGSLWAQAQPAAELELATDAKLATASACVCAQVRASNSTDVGVKSKHMVGDEMCCKD